MKTIPNDGCYIMLTDDMPTFGHYILCVLAGGASGHKGLIIRDGRMYLWGFFANENNKLKYDMKEVERLPDCCLIKTDFGYDYFANSLNKYKGKDFKLFTSHCCIVMLLAFGWQYFKIIL